MERSGLLLERANLAFHAVNGANTNDTLQATDTKTSPLLAAHNDFIYLNPKLFQRFKTLHDHQAELNLNPEQAKLLDVYYKQFVHAGRRACRRRSRRSSRRINKRLSTLQTDFTQKLLAAAKAGALHVTDPAALAGLSRRAARSGAGGGQGPQARRLCPAAAEHDAAAGAAIADQPRHAPEAVRREPQPRRAWRCQRHAQADRARSPSCARKKAALFGDANWADYTLYDQMAKNRETAVGFLDRLAPAVSAKQRQEAADIRRARQVAGRDVQADRRGLELLRRADPQAALRARQRPAEALFRVQQGARATASSMPPTSSTG